MGANITIQVEQLQLGFKTKRKTTLLGVPLNAEARKGQLIALIGSNGAGKSTLIKNICKLQHPVSGSVLINNQDIQHQTRLQLARQVSLVSTDLERTAKLSVYELVALGRFPHSNWLGQISENDHQIIMQAIEQVGMMKFTENDGLTLSDGEYQRVMIARALAQDTDVIILDEPTAFLDLPNKYQMVHLLWELTRTHSKTVLFSTHDLNIAMQHADVLWIMANNTLIEGTPEDLLINGTFDHLFKNRDMIFDPELLQFRKEKIWLGTTFIEGDNELVNYTRLALERLGYKMVSNKLADVTVKIYGNRLKPYWELNINNRQFNVASLAEMSELIVENKK